MANNDGQAETLSPYAPNFWNHIEEGIKPLVQAFVDKGFLPYSSCEGHSPCGRRFVSLAFPTKEATVELSDQIKILDESLITFQIKTITDYYHDPKYGERDTDRELGWLNSIYLRGYEQYYFLEVSIGENSPPSINNVGLIVKKILCRNGVTEKLVKHVEEVIVFNPN